MAASIAHLLDGLPNSDNVIETLDDLKTLLGSVHPDSLVDVVPNISFNCVFDCLATNSREQLELCCDVLIKLLTALPPTVILNQFHDELLAGLTHQAAPVRRLCVTQVGRVGSENVSDLLSHTDVVIQTVKTLADEDLSIAQCAENVIFTIGCSSEGLNCMYFGAGMSSIQDILVNKNDTIKFRLYEVLVKICRHWELGLQRTVESGVLQNLLNVLLQSDILLQLNCLELLSDMVTSEHCLAYLDQQGTVGKIEGMMKSVEDDPLAIFLIPGLVKFFGGIARLHPKEVCSNNPVFVHTVFSNLSPRGDPSLHSLAVQTIGFIGGTVEGKLALEKLGSQMEEGIRNIGKQLRDAQSDIKIIVLQSLASLLKLEVRDQTAELIKLTERWYNLLGVQTVDHLMSLVEQPFLELRSSAHLFIQTLILQPWGQIILNNFPGFKEYLLNRDTEKTKDGKEGKFNIVRTLTDSPTVSDIFGQPYYVQLKVYVAQGPFYVATETQVAMEGES